MDSITIRYQYKGPQYIGLTGKTKHAEIALTFFLWEWNKGILLACFVVFVIIVNLLVFVVLRVCGVFYFV